MSIPPLVCSTPPPPDQCEDDRDPEDYDIHYNLSQEDEDDNYDFSNFSSYNYFQSSQSKTDPVITTESKSIITEDPENVHGTNTSESKTERPAKTHVENIDLKLVPETILPQDKESSVEVKSSNFENNPVSKPAENSFPSSVLESALQTEEYVEPPNLDKPEQPPSSVDKIIDTIDSLQITPTIPDLPRNFPQDGELNEEPSIPVLKEKILTREIETVVSATEVPKQEDDNFVVTSNEELSNAESKEKKEPITESITIISETEVPKQADDNFVGTSNVDLSKSESKEKEVPIIRIKTTVAETEVLKQNDDDDFGDFDDFKFAAPVEKPATLDHSQNPWEGSNIKDNDFGDFKANFDDGEHSQFSAAELAMEHSSKVSEPEEKIEATETHTIEAMEEDDFGDFSDFQTSHGEVKDIEGTSESHEPTPKLPILNLEGSEEEIKEHIENVINSAFPCEIEEPVEELNLDDMRLESALGEVWANLLTVHERQPYMVNWNNTVARQNLLKALGIDSRNILYGPNRSSNMPKYATTLSDAPLQPKKQVPSPTQTEPSSQEKGKSDTWSDPFTSDGNESCKPEPEPSRQSPVIETGPTDLDVFEASTSSKPDKIFPSTLSVQPVRHISLPDTHIFTPTDSEIPRSTTIHYDDSPPVLQPQTVIGSQNEPSFQSERSFSPQPGTSKDIDDYWEFQDFQGPSTSKTTSVTPNQPELTKTNANVTYDTQVLQPIKLEPTVPTLNWPDPGEVKETFDDFSDFVSNTPSSSQPTPIVPVSQIDSKDLQHLPEASKAAQKTNQNIQIASSDFDDDFDTFQSALPAARSPFSDVPSSSSISDIAAGGTKTGVSAPAGPLPKVDFNFAFPKDDNVKSEPISFETMNKPKDSLQTERNLFRSNLEIKGPASLTPSTSTATGQLLQPKRVNSTATLQPQKSAQILQPLSLESFSQINWPNPGIDLQDLSRFNPVETLNSFKSDLSVNSPSKVASPVHRQKGTPSSQLADDEWGDFVSPPPPQHPPKKPTTSAADDDEWTDFVSSPSVKPQNGVNTISFNVHTNTNLTTQKPNPGKYTKKKQLPLDIPPLNYIIPKSAKHKTNDRHLNL